jgi:putative redox protein
MKSAVVRWAGGGRFIGTDHNNHSVVLSTNDEGIGMNPSALLLVAVASCSSVDVVEILAKKRYKLQSLEVNIEGEQDADPPWTYRKINLKYTLRAKGLLEKDVAQAIHLSEEKYCSVAATVRGVAKITTSYEILPEED